MEKAIIHVVCESHHGNVCWLEAAADVVRHLTELLVKLDAQEAGKRKN